ncbi:bacteriohemerythrin [Telmatospirillum sp. J64-1]|uniref:bacteriohemerythrin n=1 Tax=Telmatospirillum sp. J64-1 TaxID=2502183 RepID=UPI00115D453F|nr:bacteriohemerythrin [Telmatospirillum sp. J64-1]
MPIVWRDALGVGEPVIDGDHKYLIKLINEFEAATEGRIDHTAIASIISHLFGYTQDHFAREEALQRAARYPFYESHRQAHQELIRKLNVLHERYCAAKDGPERDEMVRDLAIFLREWLVNHIIEQDLRLKPFVVKAPVKTTDA